jgi:hypothetical protein
VTDIPLLAMSTILIALVARIVWLRDRLKQPVDWSPEERRHGRILAWSLAAAALISGLVAAYVAARVPWVDNLPAMFPDAPHVVAGREPLHISTAWYLFSEPVGLGLFGAWLTDPWAVARLSFRGPRDLVLRTFPLFAFGLGLHAVWKSIHALRAAY